MADSKKRTTFLLLGGSCCAFLAVALGAFAGHVLQRVMLPEQLVIFRTGVEYQFHHALGMLVAGVLAQKGLQGQKWFCWAGEAFFVGIVLFSGSLYLLSSTGVPSVGWITPIGGIAFLLGWSLLARGVWVERFNGEKSHPAKEAA